MSDTIQTPAPGRTLADIREPAIVAGWVAGILAAIAIVRLLVTGLPWAIVVGGQQAAQQQMQGEGELGGLYDLSGPSAVDYIAAAFGDLASAIFVTAVPFAVGVMFTLFLMQSVSGSTGFVALVVRGVLASLGGAFVAAVVWLIQMALPTGGGFSPETLFLQLLGFVALAATYAPVVLLVLVVRTYVPRASRA